MEWMESTWANSAYTPHVYYLTDKRTEFSDTLTQRKSEGEVQRLKERVVVVECPRCWRERDECSNYRSHMYKANLGLYYLWQNVATVREAKWVLIIGDDNYVHIPNLIFLLQSIDVNKPVVLGQMGKEDATLPSFVENGTRTRFYGGAGILFNFAAMQQIGPNLPRLNSWLESFSKDEIKAKGLHLHDVAIGHCVQDLHIPARHLSGLYSQTLPYYFTKQGAQAYLHSYHSCTRVLVFLKLLYVLLKGGVMCRSTSKLGLPRKNSG